MPTAAPTRLATYFHVHLVSDSTGETLNAMARAVCARFDNVLPIEHIYALVRSQRQLDRALGDIEEAPGVVMHTIVDDKLRSVLEEGCRRLDMPCIPALDPLVSALSRSSRRLSRRLRRICSSRSGETVRPTISGLLMLKSRAGGSAPGTSGMLAARTPRLAR